MPNLPNRRGNSRGGRAGVALAVIVGLVWLISGSGMGENLRGLWSSSGTGAASSGPDAQAGAGSAPAGAADTAGPEPVESIGRARDELAALPVRPARDEAGYEREDWEHWSNAEDFGWRLPGRNTGNTGNIDDLGSCDARDAALLRDADASRTLTTGEYCEVQGGRWTDPYSATIHTDPSEVDVDHIVPLANAHRSGASGWSAAERERYANDPGVLVSASAEQNSAKGDAGPEEWLPPDAGVHCDYATRWVAIKSAYGLSVTPAEGDKLEEILAGC